MKTVFESTKDGSVQTFIRLQTNDHHILLGLFFQIVSQPGPPKSTVTIFDENFFVRFRSERLANTKAGGSCRQITIRSVVM